MTLRLCLICIVFILRIVLNNSSPQVDNDDCPKNFERSGNKCYFMPIDQLSWFGANAVCRRLNADLLTIENEAEMTAISRFLHKKIASLADLSKDYKSTWFWTSGNDIDHEGQRYWHSNGQIMSYQPFAHGEPNDKNFGEDCFHLWHNSTTSRFEMNDYKCRYRQKFVCEAKLKFDENELLDLHLINAEVARLSEAFRVDGKLPKLLYAIN